MPLGAAVHSLRAVSGDSLREVFGASLWRDRPLHMFHMREQRKEVEDCLAHTWPASDEASVPAAVAPSIVAIAWCMPRTPTPANYS